MCARYAPARNPSYPTMWGKTSFCRLSQKAFLFALYMHTSLYSVECGYQNVLKCLRQKHEVFSRYLCRRYEAGNKTMPVIPHSPLPKEGWHPTNGFTYIATPMCLPKVHISHLLSYFWMSWFPPWTSFPTHAVTYNDFILRYFGVGGILATYPADVVPILASSRTNARLLIPAEPHLIRIPLLSTSLEKHVLWVSTSLPAQTRVIRDDDEHMMEISWQVDVPWGVSKLCGLSKQLLSGF